MRVKIKVATGHVHAGTEGRRKYSYNTVARRSKLQARWSRRL